ncbi:MAG: hypothetical protein M1820_006638 [Bogoriella megaspora]|nr:MAG: hypothetical protein M1820_006638 [Bogoriella megaspora]
MAPAAITSRSNPRVVPAIPLNLSRSSQKKTQASEPFPSESPADTFEAPEKQTSPEQGQDTTPEATPPSSKIRAENNGERDNKMSGGGREVNQETAPPPPSVNTPPSYGEPAPSLHLSDRPSVPRSTTSSSLSQGHRNTPMSNPGFPHRSQPRANGIVFGGYADSSSSSPAPPAQLGGMPYPPPPMPGPNAYGPYGPPIFFSPTHSHHRSEPYVQGYPPPSSIHPLAYSPNFRRPQYPIPMPMYGPPHQWVPRGQPPPFYQGHSPFDNRLAQDGGPYNISQPNFAISSSPSNREQAVKASDSSSGDLVTNGATAPAVKESHRRYSTFDLPMPGQSFGFETVEDHSTTVQDFLYSQFGNSDFADYILRLTQIRDFFPSFAIPVHGVIVARSPLIAHMIRSTGSPDLTEDGRFKMLALTVKDRFINGFAFIDVLRHLYGDPLIDADAFTQGFTPPLLDPSSADLELLTEKLNYAFAYAASGHFLHLGNVVIRGLEIATRLLRWETVEKSLGFALDGGIGPNWKNEDVLEDRDSISSGDETSTRQESSNGSPTFGAYSNRFLQNVVDFIIYHFPKDFTFDATVSQLQQTPRFPRTIESRPATSNVRLSQIQFGQVPIEEVSESSKVTKLVSSILITLPFLVLKHLLENYALGGRLGWPKVVEIMNEVIEERENRRSQFLKNRPAVTDDAIWSNACWEEFVDRSPTHGSGYTLRRRPKGLDTPTSSTSNRS